MRRLTSFKQSYWIGIVTERSFVLRRAHGGGASKNQAQHQKARQQS
jgi:hypothetical protein